MFDLNFDSSCLDFLGIFGFEDSLPTPPVTARSLLMSSSDMLVPCSLYTIDITICLVLAFIHRNRGMSLNDMQFKTR